MAEKHEISRIGKLPEQVLKRSVLKQIGHRRKEVLTGPAVGLDCAALTLQENEVLVLSSDPITAAVEHSGSYAIHVTANDLAASGAEPVGVLITALLPPGITEEEIRQLVSEAEACCSSLHMEMLGGHTEITPVVNQPLLSVTGVGKIRRDCMLSPEHIRPGQSVLVTKWIGLEATAILAARYEDKLKERFSPQYLQRMKDCGKMLSVLPEARLAMEHGVVAMHDVTEGGIFGALWEIAEAGKTGLEIDARAIPVRQETVELCEFLGLNPYQIMSSGAMLMIAEDGEQLCSILEEAGISAAVIGRTTKGNDRILRNQGEVRYLDRPQQDQLYQVL